MATILRVKRKRNEGPVKAITVSAKRARQDVSAADIENIGFADESSKSTSRRSSVEQLSSKEVFRLSGTANSESDVVAELRKLFKSKSATAALPKKITVADVEWNESSTNNVKYVLQDVDLDETSDSMESYFAKLSNEVQEVTSSTGDTKEKSPNVIACNGIPLLRFEDSKGLEASATAAASGSSSKMDTEENGDFVYDIYVASKSEKNCDYFPSASNITNIDWSDVINVAPCELEDLMMINESIGEYRECLDADGDTSDSNAENDARNDYPDDDSDFDRRYDCEQGDSDPESDEYGYDVTNTYYDKMRFLAVAEDDLSSEED